MEKWIHKTKNTDKNVIVAAELFHDGMEDGYIDIRTNKIYQYQENNRCRPYIYTDSYVGKLLSIVKRTDYVVIRNGKKFVFSANWFLKNYEKTI
jgi:hypothetical protein